MTVSFQYQQSWEIIDYQNSFDEELENEVSPQHLLYGIKTKVIARRGDRDDFLFQLLDASNRYAVVHLTWQKENSNIFPGTLIYDNFEHWIRESHDYDIQYWNEILDK